MTKPWWTRAVVGRTSVSDPLLDHEAPDARFEVEWRPNMKSRLLIMLGILGVWAVAVEANLLYLQVYSHERFEERARKQQQDKLAPEAPRGDIVDRNGQVLAYSVPSMDVYADPSLLTPSDPAKAAKAEKPVDLARELCAAFGDCTTDELAQITEKLMRPARKVETKGPGDTTEIKVLAMKVPIRKASAMSAGANAGLRSWLAARAERKPRVPAVIFVEERDQRYHPKMDLAAHVVGFVGADGKGAAGVELRYDKEVRGEPGYGFAYVDGHTNQVSTRVERAPVPGASLELTIDVTLQNVAEQALQAAVTSSKADGGTAIVMASQTGEILAQASLPAYNPNMYRLYSDEIRRDPAVMETYEPGSTMKIVTVAAALNDGLVKASDLIDTRPGFITLPGRVIKEDKGHNYGVLTVEEVLIRSSNVGAAMIGWKIGPARMLQHVQAFGLGQRIAPDVWGQAVGGVGGASTLNNSGLASVSMGYQIAVTPMQMVTAANVIATGGLLMEPRILRAFVRNGHREEIQPKALRRVITPETAAIVTAAMEGVVVDDDGTANTAALTGYQVAGKTGTTAKIVNKRYSTTDYNVSFVGFVPSRNPLFTILVVVDTPRVGPRYGGRVAAPVFKRIAEAALQYVGVPRTINPIPPIVVPAERSVLPTQPTRASTIPPTITHAGGRPVMPDLRGLTLRDAVRIAQALHLQTTAEGDGVVVFQTPQAGTVIDAPGRATLQLRRAPARAGDGGSR